MSTLPSTTDVSTARPAGLLRWIVRRLADVVVPPVCLACQAPLQGADTLCAHCWRDIAFIRPPLCDRLGLPLPFGPPGETIVSAAAVANPPDWNRARAVGVFARGGVLRDLVHGLKYSDRQEARRLLGRWMTEAGRDLFPDCDMIVPVPLTRWRLMRRQFNQSALLAWEVSRATGIPADPMALAKTRTTRPQVGLTRDQRRDNVRNAFAVPERKRRRIAGRNLLLVDDVITTGATIASCARALKAAGAGRVDVLTVGMVAEPIPVDL